MVTANIPLNIILAIFRKRKIAKRELEEIEGNFVLLLKNGLVVIMGFIMANHCHI